MTEMLESPGNRQQQLLRLLLRNKRGLAVEAIGRGLEISRNAVRQHLAALERDGLVKRGASLPSGGRPEQLYVLTAKGLEQFPRQYSWLAEILLQELASGHDGPDLKARLTGLGRKVAASIAGRLSGNPVSAERLASLAAVMNELGYDTAVSDGGLEIDAYNCVFHSLAARNADVCSFDLALLSACSGGEVEHRDCMVRGGGSCKFSFSPGNIRKGG